MGDIQQLDIIFRHSLQLLYHSCSLFFGEEFHLCGCGFYSKRHEINPAVYTNEPV